MAKSGIRGNREAPGKGVYCMPVLPNYFISYQWLRELKRRGARRWVAVHFRLNSEEPALVGHYNQPHQKSTVGQAIRIIFQAKDARGYEIVIPQKIHANEITKIKPISGPIGWRYEPDAHGKAPCDCPVCLRPGSWGARKIREKNQTEEMGQLEISIEKSKKRLKNLLETSAPLDSNLLDAYSMLIQHLMEAKKFAEAESVYKQARSVTEKINDRSKWMEELLMSSSDLCRRWKKWPQLILIEKENLDLMSRHPELDSEGSATQLSMESLADAYATIKDFKQAMEWLERAMKHNKKPTAADYEHYSAMARRARQLAFAEQLSKNADDLRRKMPR